MAREIAVFRNAGGLTAALSEPGKITVFRRWQGAWEIDREMDCFLDARAGLRELRRKMGEVLTFLGDCRIFVAGAISGMPYYELEKAGFSLWEYAGEPVSYLDHVWAQEEKDALEKDKPAQPEKVGPVEKVAGEFYISLKDIQEKNAGVTSKQALLPFIRKGQFNLLEVSCNHIPPWLEAELAAGAFAYETRQVDRREIIITIIRTQGTVAN